MNTKEKLCPICKKENKEDATICRHCDAPLDESSTKYVAVHEALKKASAWESESSIDVNLIPEGGIGIQVAGELRPLYVPISWELIIGRKRDAKFSQELLGNRIKEESDSESFLDLTDMHAGSLGVSRRHAMIRRTISGYEVIDLSSRNGSWLNEQRLIPHKAYPLPNKSQLRIGNMRLLIVYHPENS